MNDGDSAKTIHTLLPWLSIFFGIFLTIFSYYPGYMSLDSFDQFSQARSGDYTYWHPPIMAWVWSLSNKMIPGPAGMLCLFATMFWVGWGLFVQSKVQNSLMAAAIILAVGLSPPVFALLGTVWKDVGMGTSLVLASGLIAHAARKKSLPALIGSIPFLFFACSLRHEGVIAAIPILIWLVFVGVPLKFPGARTRFFPWIMVALAVGIGFLGLKALLERSLVGKNDFASPMQVIWVHDLAGLSLELGRPLLPTYLTVNNSDFRLDELERVYEPGSALTLFQNQGSYRRFPAAKTREEYGNLFETWLERVSEFPGAYLKIRWRFFVNSLALSSTHAPYSYHLGISENIFGISLLKDGIWNQWVMRYLDIFRDTWVFRGWVYLALITALFSGGVFLRSLEICMLSISALSYEFVHIFVLATPDFRYRWWVVLSVFLCLTALMSEILRAKENEGNMPTFAS